MFSCVCVCVVCVHAGVVHVSGVCLCVMNMFVLKPVQGFLYFTLVLHSFFFFFSGDGSTAGQLEACSG